MGRLVHLVGSIPLDDAERVFVTVSEALGKRLARLPDGETTRINWVGSFEDVFSEHPAFVLSTKKVHGNYEHDREETYARYEVRQGLDPSDVSFAGHLPQAGEAIENYGVFERLKAAGAIPDHVRYQLQFATSSAVLRRWVVDEHAAALEANYDRDLLNELATICDALPHDQLSIQWDVASSVFLPLETGAPTRYGKTLDEMLETFGSQMTLLGEHVPRDVELMYHLCYGDLNHKHSIEPRDMSVLVGFANYLVDHVTRHIDLIHMPVPRERDDEAYFTPLQNLKLDSSRLALGLIHYGDGVEGSLRRATAASRFADDYLVATECGFGRRDPSTVNELLAIHAQVADAL